MTIETKYRDQNDTALSVTHDSYTNCLMLYQRHRSLRDDKC